jgi:hypothetical protein
MQDSKATPCCKRTWSGLHSRDHTFSVSRDQQLPPQQLIVAQNANGAAAAGKGCSIASVGPQALQDAAQTCCWKISERACPSIVSVVFHEVPEVGAGGGICLS